MQPKSKATSKQKDKSYLVTVNYYELENWKIRIVIGYMIFNKDEILKSRIARRKKFSIPMLWLVRR
jgi:hypothetical protein